MQSVRLVAQFKQLAKTQLRAVFCRCIDITILVEPNNTFQQAASWWALFGDAIPTKAKLVLADADAAAATRA